MPVEVSDGAGVGTQRAGAIQAAVTPLTDLSTLPKLSRTKLCTTKLHVAIYISINPSIYLVYIPIKSE